jgi:glycine reductase complex component B subunit gamma
MRVVHYLNQFFSGFGGEKSASMNPVRIEGPVGPGRGLQLDIVATLACGDDFFAQHEEEAIGRLLAMLEAERPDVLVCGPSFDSGRYGYACGSLAREAARRGIPCVTAMHPDSPGVEASDRSAYIIPTSTSVAGMQAVLPRIANLARRLGSGESLGPPEQEGYLRRGARRNRVADKTGATRAVDLLLQKLTGQVETEIVARSDHVPPPRPVSDLSKATLALVTEAGCVPRGNPDRLPSRRSSFWLRYSLAGVESLSRDGYETVHGGFDTRAANEDLNRLVPLDVVRQLETEGRIGRLHEVLYTTSGVDTPVARAVKFGQEIAGELKEAGIDAVLLTGT